MSEFTKVDERVFVFDIETDYMVGESPQGSLSIRDESCIERFLRPHPGKTAIIRIEIVED